MDDRLQKILSRYGVASRREAERMLQSGRVWVNGQKVTELGTRADPDRDRIEVDGKALQVHAPQFVYLLLNKPTQVVCTCDDPQGRTTVLDILPEQYQHLYPVGRLDYNSSGALLLTNHGDFANHLTHPRHHVSKTYIVWVKDRVSPETLNHWQNGVLLDERRTMPAKVKILRVIDSPKQATKTQLEIVLHEGRNRQIRRVADILGHPVLALHRVAIASINLHDLPSGKYRLLSDQEVKKLFI